MEWLLLAVAAVIAVVGVGAARGRSSRGGWWFGSRDEVRDEHSIGRAGAADTNPNPVEAGTTTMNASGSPDDRDERAADDGRDDGDDHDGDGGDDGGDGGGDDD